jgi:hypothetical protein
MLVSACDIGIADALQEYDLADCIGHVLGSHHRLRHARKAREFIDHAFDIIYLPDDGVGALLEDAPVILDDAGILSTQPLGGELNWRERVLDLVGDTTSHVGPRGGALRGHELRDIVERHDVPTFGGARLFARHPHREIAFATVAIDRHLALHQTLQPGPRSCEDFGKFGNDIGQLPSERLRFRTPD